MSYFALFHGYIVTADADGSIPLNSMIVTKIPENGADTNQGLLMELIEQANMAAHS